MLAAVESVAPLTFLDLLPREVELAIVERRLALVFAAGKVVLAVVVRCFDMERDEENAFWPFSAATLERFSGGMDTLVPGAPPIILVLFVRSGIILVRFVLLPVTVEERFSPPLGTFSLSFTGSTPPVLSRDLVAAGFVSMGFLMVGRGLASFFSASLASILLSRSSLACFNFAAISSPGSLKVA